MTPYRTRMPILAALAILPMLLSGCGGGGGGSASAPVPPPPPPPIKAMLNWDAPQSFTDNTSMVLSRDVQGFEIYLRQDQNFGPDDNPVATAAPAATSFDLLTLDPPLSIGVTYYVSIRVITVYDTNSDFSPAVPFSVPR